MMFPACIFPGTCNRQWERFKSKIRKDLFTPIIILYYTLAVTQTENQRTNLNEHLHRLSDMCVQYERNGPMSFQDSPETRLLVSKLFWLKDVGQKVGQISNPQKANL